MAGYLDQYGAGEERRNRIIIRSILGVLLAVVLVALTWYLTLNHHQESVVKSFIAALKNHDTQGAYRIWGCTTSHPCPDYPYDKFMKRLGPRPQRSRPSPSSASPTARNATMPPCSPSR